MLATTGAAAQQSDTGAGGGAGANGNADSGSALQVVPNLPPPATHVESLWLRKGSIVVRGYTDIGTVQGQDSSAIRITAIELSDHTREQRQYGLEIAVGRGSGQDRREVLAFLDEDEIAPLGQAIDALRSLGETGVTALMNFDSTYRTRGDLEVTNFAPANGGRMIAIRAVQLLRPTGQLVWATAYFPLSQLQTIQQQLAAAQQSLDRAKAARGADNAGK